MADRVAAIVRTGSPVAVVNRPHGVRAVVTGSGGTATPGGDVMPEVIRHTGGPTLALDTSKQWWVVVKARTGALLVTLPATPAKNFRVDVMDETGELGGDVTVDLAGKTCRGDGTVIVDIPYADINLVFDGTEYVLGGLI
jgi:hypothetical protein